MSVMAKMLTLLRASVREIGESVLNANASQVLEQELLDAKSRLQDARRELAALMAQQPELTRQADALRAELAAQEALAVQALQQQDAAQAEALSERVAQLDRELERHHQAQAQQSAQVDRLKTLLREAEAQVREQERELTMARTAESVQRATASVAASGQRAGSARARLEQLQQRNQHLDDRLSAQRQLEAELADKAPADAEHRERVRARLRERAGQEPSA